MPLLIPGTGEGREIVKAIVLGRQLTWVWGFLCLLTNPPTQLYEGGTINGFVFPKRSCSSDSETTPPHAFLQSALPLLSVTIHFSYSTTTLKGWPVGSVC